ncbi:MAG: hypothetical protein ACO1N0_05110 [Fluviicola sp.]
MKYFLALFFIGFLSISYSQFTSFTTSADFVLTPSNTYGIDSSNLDLPILQVRITPSDLNDVGNASVIIYDSISDTPLKAITLFISDIQTGVSVENGTLIFNFTRLSTENSYKIYVEAQNSNMGYLNPYTFYFTEN